MLKNINSETDLKSESNFPKIIFIVLLLFSIHFWDLSFIPQMVNGEDLLTWLVCGFSLIMVIQRDQLHFKNAIILFLFGLVVNMFQSYINFGQDVVDSILAFQFFYYIMIYFLLHYLQLSARFLEKIIIIFALIFSCIYFIQDLVYPYQIVESGLNLDRGSHQFEILGHGFLMLGYFLVLNRYIIKGGLINILFAVIFFYILFLGGFRTFLVVAMLLTLIMFIKHLKFNIKHFGLILVAISLFMGLFQVPRFYKKIEEFVGETNKQFSEVKKIDRLIEMEFFFTKYPKNVSYFILGGGLPGGDNVYKFYNPSGTFTDNPNIVYVDIGILGFYIVIGSVALAGLLWYTIKAIFIKLPKNKVYLNYYFLYLILGSLTTYEIYRPGIFTVQAIGLYLIDLSVKEKLKCENTSIST